MLPLSNHLPRLGRNNYSLNSTKTRREHTQYIPRLKKKDLNMNPTQVLSR